MKRIVVEVTAEDIEKGQPHDCTECPVALAIARATGLPSAVGSRFMIAPRPAVFLPVRVRRFIKNFDQRKPVKPFRFRVEVPE